MNYKYNEFGSKGLEKEVNKHVRRHCVLIGKNIKVVYWK